MAVIKKYGTDAPLLNGMHIIFFMSVLDPLCLDVYL
jgi:hypothetical protein